MSHLNKPKVGYGPGQSKLSRVKPQKQSYDLPSEDAGFIGDEITDYYTNHIDSKRDIYPVSNYVNKFKENI